ncbi:acyl-CoA reductase [Streptomyces sp. PU-14G]|uniref:acyl-CoA reductase n=1 Tax=Streptomyces sp. PU-14G TaxID=2800808 RepID=UPI0034DF07F2
MSEPSCVAWLPPWADHGGLERAAVGGDGVGGRYYGLRPAPGQWQHLGEGLRAAHESLRAMPVARIVEALDETCSRWADHGFAHRVRARADIVTATGFSAQAVDRGLDVELSNYRAETLYRVLRRELGDPGVLDGFREDTELGGHTLALGPRVTMAVCSGNVPGLPALSLVRALLVKSAVILKVASGEPTFAVHFLRSLAEVDPAVADAVVVTYWPSEDQAALRSAMEQADAVIAYGSDDACAAVRAHLQPHQRYVEHGHKVSVGVLTRDYLADVGLREVARRVAEDASTFNQHACVAPQAYLVEDGDPGPQDVAEALASAMAEYAAEVPLGLLPSTDAAALQLRRANMAWAAASSPEGGFWRSPGLDWTVTLAPDLRSVQGAGNRTVGVVPVHDVRHILSELRPLAARLQNIGLGATAERFWTLASALGRLGASRISEPGQMAGPSVVWRHDGMPCLSLLLRWCDIEMHQEARHRAKTPAKDDVTQA